MRAWCHVALLACLSIKWMTNEVSAEEASDADHFLCDDASLCSTFEEYAGAPVDKRFLRFGKRSPEPVDDDYLTALLLLQEAESADDLYRRKRSVDGGRHPAQSASSHRSRRSAERAPPEGSARGDPKSGEKLVAKRDTGGLSQAKRFMRFGRSGEAEVDAQSTRDLMLQSLLDGGQAADSESGEGVEKRFMRFGRAPAKRFMRFGRTPDKRFMRFGRTPDKRFMRFGRTPDKRFMRFGRTPDKRFMRFGRTPDKRFMRFGRTPDKRFMRFGRDPDKRFMRFGRGSDAEKRFMRFGRAQLLAEDTGDEASLAGMADSELPGDLGTQLDKRFMRFGKREVGEGESDQGLTDESKYDEDASYEDLQKRFMRFGRSNSEADIDKRTFMRFGRGRSDAGLDQRTIMRFGKRSDVEKRFMRFGKRSDGQKRFMRFGKRLQSGDPGDMDGYFRFGQRDTSSIQNSSGSPVTT